MSGRGLPPPAGAACPSFEEKALNWLWGKVIDEVLHLNANLERVAEPTSPEHLLRQFKLVASLLRARVGELALAATDPKALTRLADRIEEQARPRVPHGLAEPQPSPASEGEGAASPHGPPRHAASRGDKVKRTFRRKRR